MKLSRAFYALLRSAKVLPLHCRQTVKSYIWHLTLLLLLTKAVSVNAQDLSHLLDGQSPNKKYDTFLSTKRGQLRFRVVTATDGRVIGEFTSVFEPLQKTNNRSLELASKAGVYWSEDSRYLVLDEAYDGETASEIKLISVRSSGAKLLSLPMKRTKAFSPRQHPSWDMSFGHWSSNRKFTAVLDGETLPHSINNNDGNQISLVFKIGKGEHISVYKADQ